MDDQIPRRRRENTKQFSRFEKELEPDDVISAYTEVAEEIVRIESMHEQLIADQWSTHLLPLKNIAVDIGNLVGDSDKLRKAEAEEIVSLETLVDVILELWPSQHEPARIALVPWVQSILQKSGFVMVAISQVWSLTYKRLTSATVPTELSIDLKSQLLTKEMSIVEESQERGDMYQARNTITKSLVRNQLLIMDKIPRLSSIINDPQKKHFKFLHDAVRAAGDLSFELKEAILWDLMKAQATQHPREKEILEIIERIQERQSLLDATNLELLTIMGQIDANFMMIRDRLVVMQMEISRIITVISEHDLHKPGPEQAE